MLEAEIMVLAERGLAVLEEAGGTVWPWLSSELAQRVYVVLAGAAMVGASVLVAWQNMDALRMIDVGAFRYAQRGPKPADPKKLPGCKRKLKLVTESAGGFF